MSEEAVKAAEETEEKPVAAEEKAAEAPVAAIEEAAEVPVVADEAPVATPEATAEAPVAEAPADPEDVHYQAVEKEGTVTAIWEMQGQKHLRTIDPRSNEGKQILALFETAG